MHVGLASKNPTKVEAVRTAAKHILWGQNAEFSYCRISSGVDDQPMSPEETWQGAKNRAETLMIVNPTVDIAFGLEGGIRSEGGKHFNIGVAYLLDKSGVTCAEWAPEYEIPQAVMQLILEEDKEMSVAVAEVYGVDTIDSRDCSGTITNGRLPAAEFYRQPVQAALTHYLQKSLQ